MATPNLKGIQSLGAKVVMAKAESAKAHAIILTKQDLEVRTGLYLDSFHINVDGPLTVSVRNTAQYAKILELGQKRHPITNRRPGGWLRFIWDNPPFAPQFPPFHMFLTVDHPKVKGYKILSRALRLAVK